MAKGKPGTKMSQVIKMKQGMSYSCKEKTIILNVFKYFKSIHPEKCVTEIVRRTSKATGCSEKSVFQFRKEEASAEGFKQPSKTKTRKNININSRFVKYDTGVREAIRQIIYDLKYRNIVPSLSTILKNINADAKLPNFSLMTLRRLLLDMGFYYEREKVGSKPVLVEKNVKEAIPSKKIQINPQRAPQLMKPSFENCSNQNFTSQELEPTLQQNVNNQNNQVYLPNQNRCLPMPLMQSENHFMEPPRDHLHVPPNMLISHRMPPQIHPVSHGMPLKPEMNFMHHAPPYPHNFIMQQ